MNVSVRLAAVALALAAWPAAAAEQRPPRAGLGVGLSSTEIAGFFGSSGVSATQLYFPINVSSSIRIEPQVGLLTVDDDAFGTEQTTWTVGVGLLFLREAAPQVLAYAGPRIALSFVEQTFELGPSLARASGTNFRLAGVVGGEYQFSPHFSVGAEGQLGYLVVGDQDIAGGAGTIEGGTSWHTTALVFVRVFLL